MKYGPDLNHDSLEPLGTTGIRVYGAGCRNLICNSRGVDIGFGSILLGADTRFGNRLLEECMAQTHPPSIRFLDQLLLSRAEDEALQRPGVQILPSFFPQSWSRISSKRWSLSIL